jgi:hypothetical protein
MPNVSTSALTLQGIQEFRVIERADYSASRDARDIDAQCAMYAQLCGPITVTYVKAA